MNDFEDQAGDFIFVVGAVIIIASLIAYWLT
jgi:hypothetical protein